MTVINFCKGEHSLCVILFCVYIIDFPFVLCYAADSMNIITVQKLDKLRFTLTSVRYVPGLDPHTAAVYTQYMLGMCLALILILQLCTPNTW